MLKLEHISQTFNKGTDNEIKLFQNFSVNIERGKCTVLLGSNGCGKSTLLNLIAGSVKLDRGTIILDNEDITKLKEEERALAIGRVYQNPSLGVSPSLTILENMALADKKGDRFFLKRLIRMNRIGDYQMMLSELGLGLEDKLHTKVKYLSGGQRQSLSLLMAAMKKPKILLLDEHTAALDPKTSQVIMEKTRHLLEKMAITTLMISHNMRDAVAYSDRVVMLSQGEIILDQLSHQLTEKELLSIYTQKARQDILEVS